jgi:PAS domain S-box-containing protein
VAENDRTSCSDEHHGSRLGFETLISDTSASLFAAPLEQLNEAVEGGLKRVREFFHADRCALLSVSEDRQVVRVRMASCSEAVSRVHGVLNAAQMFPWSWQLLDGERAPVRIARLADLPPEAATDRESFTRMATRSSLTIPIETGGVLDHLIVVDTVHREREWPDALVHRLRVLGELLIGALKRQEMILDIRESEERLRLAAESAEAGLWGLDLATLVFWVTPRTRAIHGFDPGEVVTMDRFKASVHPDDQGLVEDVIERSVRATEPIQVEYRILKPGADGLRWVSSRGRSHVSPDGRAIRLMGVTLDVSELKLAEKAAQASGARLRQGADLAGLGFLEMDFAAGLFIPDDRIRDLFGFPQDEVGMGAVGFWLKRLHPADRKRIMRVRSRLLRGEVEHFSIEYRYLHPERGEVWVHHLAGAARHDAGGATTRTYGVVRDITTRKRAEEDLHDLSRRLIGAHEEERAMLARELHDDLSQRLAVLAIEAGRAELDGLTGPQAESMRALREGLVSASEDVHSLAYRLHPSVLEELGLLEALRAECEHRGRRHEFEVAINVDPLLPDMDRDVALCLFRVAQEALGNAARHAQASAVTVTLRNVDDGLLLMVADDGVGFDPEKRDARHHLGLASMRERTRLAHGTLDVESAPGRGTTVVAWVPMERGPE